MNDALARIPLGPGRGGGRLHHRHQPSLTIKIGGSLAAGLRLVVSSPMLRIGRSTVDATRSPTRPTYRRSVFPIEELLDGGCTMGIAWLSIAQMLLNFWRRQGGRHKATGLREHRVLRVLKSKKSRTDKDSRLYQCQWIGLPASDDYTTWLSLDEVTDIALGQWLEFVTGLDDIFG
ncbi:hypothetical protein FOVSG1_010582 [Fusarium oxysporum f. sp. vasinfectum]